MISGRAAPDFGNEQKAGARPALHIHSLTAIPTSRNLITCSTILQSLTNDSYRFKVEDSGYVNDSLAAWACIRLDRLQHGYRFVNLLDAKGQATAGLLLVKVEKSLR